MSDLTRRANRRTSNRVYHHRRALVPLLSLVAIVGVSGAAGAEQTLTVGVVHYSGEALNYFQNTIVHEFEQQHPGVKVVLQTGTWATWKEKLQTWYAANTLPDAFQIGSQDLGGLAPFAMLLPIDQYVKGWAELGDFPPVELQDGTYEGKLYDIPYALNLRTLAYRKDLFAQVGLDPNRPPDNWDELAGFAQKLTKRDAAGNITQAGFNATPDWHMYMSFLYQAGGHVLSADLHKVTLADPPAVEAAQFFGDLVNRYDVSPPKGTGGVKGEAAMEYAGAWITSVKTPGVEIAVPQPPMGPAARTGALLVNKWVIGSQSKNPDLAWEWIKFVSSTDNMAAMSERAGLMPPRRSVINSNWSPDPLWRDLFAAASNATAFRAQVPTFDTIVADKAYLPAALTDIFANKKSAAQALREVSDRAQAELDAFWKGMKE